MSNESFPGLDYDFLRYIGVTAESQRRIQGFYLPFFQNCHKVIDLGCGDGDFVTLLNENGIATVGVDSDEKAYQAAMAKGLPIVQQDLIAYLQAQPANSVDGIFSAHVVEHLPYPTVILLIQEAFRVLQPGGRLILTTPDVRTLFSHLEMFYLHFGHISFLHPRLLCFFLDYTRFTQIEFGTNPQTASALLPEVATLLRQAAFPDAIYAPSQHLPVDYRREIPLQGHSFLQRWSYRTKRWLTHMLVQPITDNLVANLNQNVIELQNQLRTVTQQQQQLTKDVSTLAHAFQSLNGPFECYATGIKPNTAPTM
ncbi:MAG: class I SAM-dependent methyltransferase [Chloroflexi bacterium]|nr:class I SAM-dependent methyltransferase [Chloroflexota bacterium]